MGGRSFNPELADPSEAGALASALWELQLLSHHYHPHVAQVCMLNFLSCRAGFCVMWSLR